MADRTVYLKERRWRCWDITHFNTNYAVILVYGIVHRTWSYEIWLRPVWFVASSINNEKIEKKIQVCPDTVGHTHNIFKFCQDTYCRVHLQYRPIDSK